MLHDEVSTDLCGRSLDFTQTQINVGTCLILGCVPQPAFGSLDENSSVSNPVVLPKVGLAFDVTPEHTVAVTINRGDRAGFSEAVPGTTVINTVDPAFLWSYEVAYRSRWLNDLLQFHTSGFYYDYEDQQILTSNTAFPDQTITQNAGSSTAYGGGFEVRNKPLVSLEVFTSPVLPR